ncbi:MAG: hypothetical protein IKD06_00150 [Clostridia bacterium]|nr:hypothetical protein [Clostridia bacterium]
MIVSKIDKGWQAAAYWSYNQFIGTVMENGWEPRPAEGWVDISVPGSLVNDLFKAGIIKDPLFEKQSQEIEWINNRWWCLRNRDFRVPEEYRGRTIRLIFKGIDYEAEIHCNGKKLGNHIGMFHPAVFDITDIVKFGEPNALRIRLEQSPFDESVSGWGSRKNTVKTTCSYKWDFCTRLVDMGLYDDVVIDVTGRSRFGYTHIRYTDEGVKRVVAEAEVYSDVDQTVEMAAELSFEGRTEKVQKQQVALIQGLNHVRFEIPVKRPRLWWPNGYGAQPLYDLKLTVTEDGVESDRLEKKVGLRTISYCRNPGAPEDAFPYTVLINGRRIWLKGANTCPIDLMTGLSTDERYEHMVKLAHDGNFNLFRVWGGGNFEREIFYDLCDKYGILIFQEFQQSNCVNVDYPSVKPDFLALFKKVSTHVVKTLRNHACLAYFSGGNEIRSPKTGSTVEMDHPNIAMLAGLVKEHAPYILMLPTSGSGPMPLIETDKLGPDYYYHDMHGSWIYFGPKENYRVWNEQRTMVNTEFGVNGMSEYGTLLKIIGRKHLHTRNDNTWLNPIYYHHGEGWDTYLRDKALFGEMELKDYIKISQFIMAEGLRYGYESRRRCAFENCGAFVWQFNEPFPNASCTSIMDYYGNPKLAYYFIRDALKGRHVSLRYDSLVWAPGETFKGRVFVHQDGQQAEAYTCTLRLLDEAGKEVFKKTFSGTSGTECAVEAGSVEWDVSGITDGFLAECTLEMGGKKDKNVYAFFIQSQDHPLLSQSFALDYVRKYRTHRL